MLNIVLFGPPGAGKGTQADLLIKKYNLIHLSTGDILRAEIKEGTSLGLEAKKLMDNGLLVPDKVVIEMIKSKIERNPQSKGFIFDGFPRTQTQAQELDKLLNQKSTSISIMLSLKVDNQELITRLLNRGIESGRADDQNESIIANRIHEYNLKTTPLKEYYGLQKKLHEINGIGSISEIANELNQTIDNL